MNFGDLVRTVVFQSRIYLYCLQHNENRTGRYKRETDGL